MLAESLLFALLLVVVGQTLSLAFANLAAVPAAALPVADAASGAMRSAAARTVSFVGAGIYEEVLFRLGLLPLCLLALRPVVPRAVAMLLTVLLTSLVFAVAHYVEPAGAGWWIAEVPSAVRRVAMTQSLWFSFAFRSVAGALFAILFLRRGFGVTVGAHACYDVLVGVVMQPHG
jgi:hypothetical protein